WENASLPFLLKKKRNFIYHSPGYVLPAWCPTTAVITVHDIIALKYPQFCQNESIVYFTSVLPQSIRRADKIIAVSQSVKNDIVEGFGISSSKIEVIYHGVRAHYRVIDDPGELQLIAVKYGLPSEFILFVGNIEPKKNLRRLLQAFSLLKKNNAIQ